MNAILSIHTHYYSRAVMLGILLFSAGLPNTAIGGKRIPYFERGTRAYASVMFSIKMTMGHWCNSKNTLRQAHAATFMEEHSRMLLRLCVPDARLAACTPVEHGGAEPAYDLRARLGATTNALHCRLTLHYNQRAMLEAIVYDRAVTLPDGRCMPAATPIPIETVMQACARLRQTRAPAVADLALTAASFGGSYASPDYLKAKTRATIRGSVPVPYTSFEQISSFGITPMGLFESDYAVVSFDCVGEGIQQGKKPKYVMFFGYPTEARGAGKSELYAAFTATLQDGQLNFVYKLFLDNRRGDVFTQQEYDDNRAKMKLSKNQRQLNYGRYIFAVNEEEHELANVPILMRASRGGCSAKKVKAPAVTR